MEQQCEVVLQTPLGPRNGSLRYQCTEGRLQGTLQMMNKTHPFCGVCRPDGQCSFSGTLETLMHKIPYSASGILTEQALRVEIHAGRNTFILQNRPAQEGSN